MKPIPYGYHSLDPKDIGAVIETLESDIIAQGPAIRRLEEALAAYCRARYAVCVSSGTSALHVACLAAGIRRKDEVITSPITFVASSNCVLYCGGRPVFADIQEETVNIDPDEIRKKITARTSAIIPVHFAGLPCDLARILALAKKNDLMVIEDAAHALGAKYGGSKIGSCRYSDMATFSFHPVKSITTGEGGAITTNSKELYERLLMFRNHGITRDRSRFTASGWRSSGPWYYEMQELGFNYRITDFQCAMGISQLKKLDRFIERRRTIALRYNRAWRDIEGIRLPAEDRSKGSAWHIYVIRLVSPALLSKKKTIVDRLRSEGIIANVHYLPVYLHPYYRRILGYKKGLCPEAERYYEEALTVPLFPRMTEQDVSFVIKTVRKVFETL